MLNYNELKNKAREFLAATGLKPEGFEKLLPAFRATYEKKYPSDRTREGKARQRRADGGGKGMLRQLPSSVTYVRFAELG
jgi:hypothetical protein